MCNIEEDESPIQRSPRGKADKTDRRTCMKCSKAQAVVLVRLNDPLCKSCFMTYFIHKFRASIGKARVIRNDDKVLLAVSGGPCSLAMLKLVCEGVSENVARRFRFRPGVIYIDEGALVDMGESERTKIKQEVREFVTQNGNFDFHEVNLEDLYHPGNLQDTKTTIDETEDYTSTATIQKLKRCFDSLMSLTAKEDLLKSMKQQQLIKVAIKEGYPKVMMGDSSSRISVRILSNISQGRGEALSFDTGFVDSRHGEVTILRPMREFVAKEIFLYNFFQGIEAISIPTLATKSNCYASIDRLTEEFISGLQAQFPFTINTIFRTGDKLTLKDNCVSGFHCSLCEVPLVQSEQGKLTKKFEQIKLENCQETENHKADARDGDFKDCCGSSGSGSAGQHTCISQKKNARAVSKEEVTKTLCYGCSLTLKDMKAEYEALPSFVTESTSKQFNQAQMKDQIDEFLLED